MKKFVFQVLCLVATILMWSAASTSMANAAAASAGHLDWENGTIIVKGFGAEPPNTVNRAQAMMLARRAAIVDGYRQLAETVNGVHIDADTTVENFIVTSDVSRAKVSAVIQGAEVIDEHFVDGGGYEVTMRIAMFGSSNSLAEAVMPAPKVREPFPQPITSVSPSMPAYDSSTSVKVRVDVTSKQSEPKPATNNKAIGGYTGLIVDCRSLGLKPVMSPVIKNADGEAIYGHKNLNPDYVIANGMASYTSDLSSGTSRAGNNPLVIKAVKLENHDSYPIVSTADANRVLIENKANGFLEKTNVVFVY